MNKRNTLKTIAYGGLLTLGAGLFSACSDAKPQFRGVDITGADYATRLPAARPQRPAAQHQGLRRQGRRRLLRLHPVPRRLPDLHGRAGRGQETAGPGRRQAAGHLRHGRPRARHRRDAQGLHDQLRPQLPGADPHARAAGRHRQGLQGLLQEGRRQDAHQLHHGPLGRQLRVRPARPPAPVQPLRQRRAGPCRGRRNCCSRAAEPARHRRRAGENQE